MKKFLENKGVTAMEALIGIGLVSVIVLSVYSSLTGAMSNVNESRMRTGALALANEKIEIIRNLPYSQIGTVDGIIGGPILQYEEVQKNNYIYSVNTEVRYLDDATDGVFPDDLINTDYKQVFIEVGWGNEGKNIALSSVFVPEGMEADVGGGTLSVNVLDSSGTPVSAVSIEIQSLDDNPPINYHTGTDDLGNLILPGVPAQNYRLYLSKNDYENVRTYPNPPGSSFTPLDPDINIVENFLNTKTFFMDRTADLILEAVDIATDSGIEGVDFEIVGGKKIGIDPDTFNINQTKTTDSSGNASFSDVSPGSYQIVNLDSLDTSEYAFVGTEEKLPVEISSGEEKTIKFLFADKNTDSLVVSVKDAMTDEALAGASVHLEKDLFSQTIITGDEGVAFFPQSPEILLPGNYSLDVSLEGYSSYDDDSVEINDLVKKSVELTPE